MRPPFSFYAALCVLVSIDANIVARSSSSARRSELNLKAGDFHVATPSSSHPPGRTVNGCLVHVVMSLDQH